MNKVTILGTAALTLVVLALPFVGGGGPGMNDSAAADAVAVSKRASALPSTGAPAGSARSDAQTLATQFAESCDSQSTGSATSAPGITSELGVVGTTTDDLAQFAAAYNGIRIENCLDPLPLETFVYDSCMETRLIWMAEDPSQDPMSAWGHVGTERSDGVPSVGCDGNLAGGTDNTAATIAQKWWDSADFRKILYRDTPAAGKCLGLAMSHGGVPNEPYPFTRAAARWIDC